MGECREVPVTASGQPFSHRTVFATDDAERAREFMGQAYGARLVVTGTASDGMRASMTHVDTGSFAVADVSLGTDLTFAVSAVPAAIFTTLSAGTAEADHGKTVSRFQPGDLVLSNAPGFRYRCRVYGVVSHNFVLPASAFHDILGAGPQRPAPLRFLAQSPVDAAASIRWLDMARFVDDLMDSPVTAGNQLVISSAARMLAAVALDTFPNNALTGPAAADRRDARPETLRRALAFTEEHAHQDITVADIAAAAHVTVRAVQLAFRRHLNTTPLAYLQQVRLERARADLMAADPGHETVTALAYRWGFSSPGRFSALYRRAYGVAPSATLHQG
jgi:AraC-like DNA-binding protein